MAGDFSLHMSLTHVSDARPANVFNHRESYDLMVILMPGKFRKRDVERKGAEKEHEKDKKFLDDNAEDLAHPEVLSKEYDSKTTPVEAEEVVSRLKKREGM